MFRNNEALIGNSFNIGATRLSNFSVSAARIAAEFSGTAFGRFYYALGTAKNDGDSNWDGYYHLSVKLGGMNFLGDEPDIDLDAEPTAVDDMSLTLGHWGYWGRTGASGGADTANILRFGLDLKYQWSEFSLWGGVMVGLDTDLAVDSRDTSITWFGEASYGVLSWLHILYQYRFQDAESLTTISQQHDAGVVVLVLENLRLRLSYTFTDDGIDNETAGIQALLGL